MTPYWLDSPGWTALVKALLHTLWQGTLIAAALGLALRRVAHPAIRYRCALPALGAVVIAGLFTWGVLSCPAPRTVAPFPAPAARSAAAAPVPSGSPPLVVNFSPPEPKSPQVYWTAWLALLWVAGTSLMLARATFQVAGAERLRRSSRPLEDSRLIALLAEVRLAVGLARRVRLAVSEKLSSPVVAGILMPTLILPLSLTTTLAPEQIRFILLHELAHIRRGDYFANLFQLFAEALLFFNPAVWWMTRQVRLEREACCDALAVELSGAPADYARTLVRVVENVLCPVSVATPALGDPREPSSLADRVQRMLVPGYRPALRLTWRAMFVALLTGGTLLFLSALGTRVTIAAILTPQQRIERIEQKMTEYGQNPAALAPNGNPESAPRVKLAGHIRMADGSPVPKWVSLNICSSVPRSSYGSATSARNGIFSETTRAGTIYIGAETTNFAPAIIGPLDGFATNDFENLELVFNPGFDVPLQLSDADSGKPLSSGTVATLFWMSNHGFQSRSLSPGPDGSLLLTHCADLPMDITVNVPGYEIIQKHYDHLRADETLRVALRRGALVSGTVLDHATGTPLPGAEIHLLYQSGAENPGRFNWDDPLHLLGKSDAAGAFTLNQLQPGLRYYLGVSAPGHESVILSQISAGATALQVRLGPELIVHGHVTSSPDTLQLVNQNPVLNLNRSEVYDDNSYGDSQILPLHFANGGATFQFTNRTAGPVTLDLAGCHAERDVTAPIDDWVVDLRPTPPAVAPAVPTREVIFRFKHPSGVPPRGAVSVSIPDNLDVNHLTAHMQDMEITNGEVRAEIPIGGQTLIEPKFMPGYWFNQWNLGGPGQMWVTVPAGSGPMTIDIPLIAAGAIYAQARNADGSPAGGLFFGVSELKRAPGRDASTPLDNPSDGFSDNSPRKWVSGPLPLGGTYQIHAWRGNSFCVGQPIKLTDASPDASVELQFPPGKTFSGVMLNADGTPLRDAEVKGLFTSPDNHSFGLKSVFTDGQGRFELENTTPDAGVYSVEADAPDIMAESVKLKFGSQPQTIRLKPGRTLGGRVVQAGTGLPIPAAEVRALVVGGPAALQSTRTDANGRFTFTTLGEGDYTFFLEDGAQISNQNYRADGTTNLTIAIKLYAWSKAKPKALPAAAAITNASAKPFTAPQSFGESPTTTSPIRGNNSSLSPGERAGVRAGVNQSPAAQNTNTPSVLITAHFYRMSPGSLSMLTSRLEFDKGYRSDNAWWSVNPGELIRIVPGRDEMLLGEPRVQTSSGQEAQLYIGNGTNGLWFNCTPVIHGALVNLTISGKLIDADENVITTNQFHAHAAAPDSGGLIMRLNAIGDHSASALVAMITVQILNPSSARAGNTNADQFAASSNLVSENGLLAQADTSPPATPDGSTDTPARPPDAPDRSADSLVREPPAAQLIHTGPGRQTIVAKLGQIHLDQVSYDGLPLNDVVKQLFQQSKLRDPEHKGINFLINNNPNLYAQPAAGPALDPTTGMPVPSATPPEQDVGSFIIKLPSLVDVRLVDVLNAIVLVSDHPLTYSIQDFAIVFSAKDPGAQQLFTRTFRVDPNTFYSGLENVGAQSFGAAQNNASGGGAQNNGAVVGTVNAFPGASALRNSGTGGGGPQGGSGTMLNPSATPGGAAGGSGQKPGGPAPIAPQTRGATPSTLARTYFKTLGVNLDNPPGKSVFFNDRLGYLFVKATESDLNTIERGLQGLNQVPPQVHLKTRFYETSETDSANAGQYLTLTNTSGSNTLGILTPANAHAALRAVSHSQDLGEPEITVASGRPVQMRATTNLSVVTGLQFDKEKFPDSDVDGQTGMSTDTVPDHRAKPDANSAPLQVHIKARFYELPRGTPDDFDKYLNLTNSNDGQPMGILSSQDSKAAIQALQSTKGFEILGEPEVTVLSGRQTQMRETKMITVVTNLQIVHGAILPQTNAAEVGPILDTVPYVLADGFIINLAAIPSLTEFEGYDQAQPPLVAGTPNSVPLPNLRPKFTIHRLVSTANVWDNQTLVLRLHKRAMDNPKGLSGKWMEKDLVIFITATIVDRAGNRVHSDDEIPFAQTGFPPQPAPAPQQPQAIQPATSLPSPTSVAAPQTAAPSQEPERRSPDRPVSIPNQPRADQEIGAPIAPTAPNQTPPPQVHIKARFYEMPKGTLENPGQYSSLTNSPAAGLTGILTAQNAKLALQALRTRKGVEALGEPEITMLSGRRAQMRTTQVVTIVTNLLFQDTSTNQDGVVLTSSISPQTSRLETGPVLDATPDVLADGYTIHVLTKASLTEFFGYAQVPTNKQGQPFTRPVTNSAGEVFNLARIWPAAEVRSQSADVNLYDNQTVLLTLDQAQADQIHFAAPDEKRDAIVSRHIANAQKKNGQTEVLVFITVTLIDPAGNRIHPDDEHPSAPGAIPPQPHSQPADKLY